jgi:hypothetical protein
MNGWEYRVIYVDFRGRISAEGVEFIRQSGEHRTGFVRRYLETLGKDGWEMTGILPFCDREQLLHLKRREPRPPKRKVSSLKLDAEDRRPSVG